MTTEYEFGMQRYLLKTQRVVLKGHRDTGKRTEEKAVLAKTILQQLLVLVPFMHLCYLSMDSIFSNHQTGVWSSPSSLLAKGLSRGEPVAGRGWHSSKSSTVGAHTKQESFLQHTESL